ncbi:MAG: hypothetical protein DMF63_11525 [Acidobacteria bacterium]|nr:MAG: hypothetical protein DMF63_11525 [Acidobacteriota bacterium]
MPAKYAKGREKKKKNCPRIARMKSYSRYSCYSRAVLFLFFASFRVFRGKFFFFFSRPFVYFAGKMSERSDEIPLYE